MRMGLSLVVVVAASMWCGLALAQPTPTHEDADACELDIHRLCESFLPDEARVASCLVERRGDLSVACAEVLARPDPDDDDLAPAPSPKVTNRIR